MRLPERTSQPTNVELDESEARSLRRRSIAARSLILDARLIQEREFTPRQVAYSLVHPAHGVPNETVRIAANVVSAVLFVLILVNLVVIFVRSLPEFHDSEPWALAIVEGIVMGFFTLELVVRLTTCESLKEEFSDPFVWVDVLSVLPYYVELIVAAATNRRPDSFEFSVFRALRLLRIFVVFKIGHYSSGTKIVVATLKESMEAIKLFCFFLCLCTLMAASALFYAETYESQTFREEDNTWYRTDGTKSPFQSITHCFWWALVTLSTLGYGDDVPVGGVGKVVATITMFASVFVVSLPVVLLTGTYQDMRAIAVEVEQAVKRAEIEVQRQHSFLGGSPKGGNDGEVGEGSVGAGEEGLDVVSPTATVPPVHDDGSCGSLRSKGDHHHHQTKTVSFMKPTDVVEHAETEGQPTQAVRADAAETDPSPNGSARSVRFQPPPTAKPSAPTGVALDAPDGPCSLPPHHSAPPADGLQRSRGSDRFVKSTPQGGVLAHIDFGDDGALRAVFLMRKLHAAGGGGGGGTGPATQVHVAYLPVCSVQPSDGIGCGGGVLRTTVSPSTQQFLASFTLHLDPAWARDRCRDALWRLGVVSTTTLITSYALPMYKVEVACEGLDDAEHYLTTTDYFSPEEAVCVSIAAGTHDGLERLVSLLPLCSLTVRCYLHGRTGGGSAHAQLPDHVVSVPLLAALR